MADNVVGFARALRAACWRDQRMVRLLPSTKGVL